MKVQSEEVSTHTVIVEMNETERAEVVEWVRRHLAHCDSNEIGFKLVQKLYEGF